MAAALTHVSAGPTVVPTIESIRDLRSAAVYGRIDMSATKEGDTRISLVMSESKYR